MKSIEYYLKGLFRNIEQTDEVKEQIEELSSHIRDRVTDLCASGMDEMAALEKTIADLGDLDELVDTMFRRKVRIRKNRIDFFEMLAGAAYGAVYLVFMTLCMAAWYFGPAALYLTVPAFAGYLIPTIFSAVRFIRSPHETHLVPYPDCTNLKAATAGWALISGICIVANLLMMMTEAHCRFWSWMPVAGVFTWPLMNAMYLFFAVREIREAGADV
ncbi:MAG TPA: permease prefix domain 1-containing protein [Treponemataceae bacterium]|jgi:hypothetical protein|nr:hypothetical protein [Treponema sp.]OQB03920.1 MAG: hypothetical protein BWY20_01128 [Spirochaetes bacterium ADurb.Bin215]HOS35205.1 permease prefix domain 1-containing protein [Treponemataceae bacterium]HOU38151.1 permease prefix domain 1-containing protein [Treponemataceae bacterium]HPA09797.1 permease prefix domain 1-containing protein [Treponemataceae bacterium]